MMLALIAYFLLLQLVSFLILSFGYVCSFSNGVLDNNSGFCDLCLQRLTFSQNLGGGNRKIYGNFKYFRFTTPSSNSITNSVMSQNAGYDLACSETDGLVDSSTIPICFVIAYRHNVIYIIPFFNRNICFHSYIHDEGGIDFICPKLFVVLLNVSNIHIRSAEQSGNLQLGDGSSWINYHPIAQRGLNRVVEFFIII